MKNDTYGAIYAAPLPRQKFDTYGAILVAPLPDKKMTHMELHTAAALQLVSRQFFGK
ncbi:MAG TPA: hypothetical protein PK385_10980 [Spirochaetota bacterium]|nr:hypothetical protein [Spirochaetota bacterium]HOS56570.1 hypothetical protein [Spirochaetota bacterium]HPK62420.1 hypothetical protein [Spirochaetota bacterium]HQF78852.1 hypothetical protein [Spirochaetota bacterium]HQH31707.1 hypothetical protein [Spirochaetota bacterium]